MAGWLTDRTESLRPVPAACRTPSSTERPISCRRQSDATHMPQSVDGSQSPAELPTWATPRSRPYWNPPQTMLFARTFFSRYPGPSMSWTRSPSAPASQTYSRRTTAGLLAFYGRGMFRQWENQHQPESGSHEGHRQVVIAHCNAPALQRCDRH